MSASQTIALAPAGKSKAGQLLPRLLAVAVASAVSGCAIVGSSRLAPGQGGSAGGVVYSLPQARIPVTLSAYQGQISLELGAPVITRDPDHTYVAQRVINPFSSDNITISVDPDTGFLTSVSATGKDESLQIFEKLLMRAGGTPESSEDTPEVLFRAELNPADATELQTAAQEITTSLRAFLALQKSTCAQTTDICSQYQALEKTLPAVAFEGHRVGHAAAGSTEPAPEPDCSIGVCYRQLQPFTFTATLAGRTQSITVNIPNAAPVLVVPIERHAFVTTAHELTFEKGTLKTATVDRPSSALALVSSPLAVASGLIRSIAEPLSALLKLDTSGQYEVKAAEETAKTAAQAQVATATLAAKDQTAGPLATIRLGVKHGDPRKGLTTGPVPSDLRANSAGSSLPGPDGTGR